MQTINGFPVIGLLELPYAPNTGVRPGRVILVDRGDRRDRYVVAAHYGEDESWNNGAYIDDRAEAVLAFGERYAQLSGEREVRARWIST